MSRRVPGRARAARSIEGQPTVDKDVVAAELAPMPALFGRSLVARRALPAGHVLAAADLSAKKPAGGIPPTQLEALLGRRLLRALQPDEPLNESHLD